MTAPKRRWFRFGLRIFFVVVTLLGLWLGYQLNWIRQRHDAFGDEEPIWRMPNLESEAPGLLWLFGEEGTVVITQGVQDPDAPTKQERDASAELQRLFPEARVRFWKNIIH